MASLYTSTDPFVRALLRLVEGQVRSYSVDHPEADMDDRVARGIAKRIAGQLVSDWMRLDGVRARFLVRSSDGGGVLCCDVSPAAGVPRLSAPAAVPDPA